jgi:hypothetical protein
MRIFLVTLRITHYSRADASWPGRPKIHFEGEMYLGSSVVVEPDPGVSLAYHPTSQASLKLHHRIGNLSSLRLTQQTLSMLAPNVITHLRYNTQPPNLLPPLTQVQNLRQTYRVAGERAGFPQINIPEEYTHAGQPMDMATSPTDRRATHFLFMFTEYC